MWDIVAVVVGALLLLILGYLYYSGLFYPISINITKPYEGELPIAYKYMIGNYKDCGPVFMEFMAATSHKTTLMGVYYDNPDVVDANKCRYIVGALLTGEGAQYRDTLMGRGYALTTIPALEKAAVVDFPMVNKLSIIIAAKRIYSALFTYLKDKELTHKGFTLELYSGNNMRVVLPVLPDPDPAFFVKELK